MNLWCIFMRPAHSHTFIAPKTITVVTLVEHYCGEFCELCVFPFLNHIHT